MEMPSESQSMSSIVFKAGYSLRFELTFVVVMLGLWFMSQLASFRQKSVPKAKHSSHLLKHANMSPSGGRKGSSPLKGSNVDSQRAPVDRLGRIDEVSPALLRDASWLVPQVTHMCRTQVRQALALYRAALEAGLKLSGDVPANDYQQMFVAMVTSAIRACSMDDAMQILRDLRQRGPGIYSSLFSSVAKLCTSKHLFAECLAVYDFMVEDPNFKLTDKSVWSCLLFCAIETHAYERCNLLFDRLTACGVPSHKDYGNMVRLASQRGDWQLSLKLVQDMREAGVEIDSVIYNTSVATCVGANHVDAARGLLEEMEGTEGLADVITYNTLMKGYAKSGCMEQCFEIFERLKLHNIVPSQVTYGILLDSFINDNQLGRAAQIFNTMISEGGVMNTVLFTTLIKGFAHAGEVDEAMKVFEQMRVGCNVTPDLITFSMLIKANCDADRFETSLKLLEEMVNLNLRPDEVVFNNLLAGCARQANVQLGKQLYADMLAFGIRPSTATFSILIRLFHQCKMLEEAVEMLRTEPAKHKVDTEPRLFSQLIQSCIRDRRGRLAVEVYEMLAENSSPSASVHTGVFTTCVKLNMFDTAAEILAIAATRGFRVDSRDCDALVHGAVRKRKMQIAQDIAASMAKIGFTVDPKLFH